MSPPRYESIDMMRALAIAGMVLCHFTTVWSDPAKNPVIFSFGDNILGDWPAAFFTFLVGVSLAISIARRDTGSGDKARDRIRGIKRGLFVFGIGLLLAFFCYGPESVFDWDILTLIGASLILLQLVRDARPAWIAAGCAGIILVTPFLQQAAGFLAFWGGGAHPDPILGSIIPNIFSYADSYYTAGFGMDAVTGFFITGYFPLFPWFLFPLAGFLTGKILFTKSLPLPRSWKFPQSLGMACMAAGVATGIAGSLRPSPAIVGEFITPFSFYPATTPMLLFLLGLTLCVLELLRRVFDTERSPAAWERAAVLLSRYSLTLYIVHIAILYVPVEILTGLYPGSPPVMLTFPPPTALGIGIVFLAGFVVLLGCWERIRGKYSFEWIMARAIGD